jgi:hypothetical protein
VTPRETKFHEVLRRGALLASGWVFNAIEFNLTTGFTKMKRLLPMDAAPPENR